MMNFFYYYYYHHHHYLCFYDLIDNIIITIILLRHIAGLHQLSMGLLRRGASSMSLATLPFDYYTHNNPLPSVDMGLGGVSRSQSVDYEQYCDTASEAESETVMIVFFYFYYFSYLFSLYLLMKQLLCRPLKH